MKQKLLIAVVLVLAGCAKGQGISLFPYQNPKDTPQHFTLCHGFSCGFSSEASITDAQWNGIASAFKTPSQSAAIERSKIADAIAKMERYATESTGLRPDRGKAETFEKDKNQMDCVDEAINSSLYLKFLEDAKLLHFHSVYNPVHRGYFVDGMWPHNAAAVQEKDTGDIYVIDSYYFDSGLPPAVVKLDAWLDDWRPAGSE